MTRTYSGAAAESSNAELSALEANQLLEHFVCGRDRLGVGGERALMLDHAHELAGEIHVRAFQRAARGCTTSTAAGSSHRRGTALASRDPQVLSSAAET